MDPLALVTEWLGDTVPGTTPVTDLLDESQGFPQVEVTLVTVSVPVRRDRRLDASTVTVNVGVTVWGAAARRPDFGTAWAAAQPVVDALTALSAGQSAGWEASTGERVENVSALLVTQSLDEQERHAVVNVSWRWRVRRSA